jgi:unsaturated chondroitin disaccharide hydrolase
MKEILKENKQWIDETWEKVDKKLAKVAVRSRNKIPFTSVDGVHDNRAEREVNWWTNGFWGGMMWLMYKETGNEEYRKTAEESERILDGAFKKYRLLHHDVGFLWHILAGANYRITGNEESCLKNLYAASLLAGRFNVDGNYIQAWRGRKKAGWTIIDTMMNLALLYWASDEIDEDRFRRVAMKHADMAIKDHIRPDGSVNHIVDHDCDTGEVVQVYAGQGYSEDSCWTRGLAWAMYGSIISYIHTKKKDYLDAAIKTANYFVANCAAYDYLTPIDFRAPLEPMYYDSTAGVCCACGLLELAKYVSEGESKMYTKAAIAILKATDSHFCNYSDDEDALVLNGSSRYPIHNELELQVPIIYGDFFFVEALTKLKESDFFIW